MDNNAQTIAGKALEICEGFKGYTIETSGKYEMAVIDLKRAREMLKAVDEEEKRITLPLNEGLRKARDFFKPVKQKLETIIAKINEEMFRYRKAEREKACIAQQEIDKQTEDIFTPQVVPNIPQTGIRIRKNWRFEIVDEKKINPKFFIPDLRTIGEVVRQFKEKAPLIVGEGIKVYFEETSF